MDNKLPPVDSSETEKNQNVQMLESTNNNFISADKNRVFFLLNGVVDVQKSTWSCNEKLTTST